MDLPLNKPTPSAEALFNEYVLITNDLIQCCKCQRTFRLGSGLSRHIRHKNRSVHTLIQPIIVERLRQRHKVLSSQVGYVPTYTKKPTKPKINYCFSCGFYYGPDGASEKWKYCPGCQVELKH